MGLQQSTDKKLVLSNHLQNIVKYKISTNLFWISETQHDNKCIIPDVCENLFDYLSYYVECSKFDTCFVLWYDSNTTTDKQIQNTNIEWVSYSKSCGINMTNLYFLDIRMLNIFESNDIISLMKPKINVYLRADLIRVLVSSEVIKIANNNGVEHYFMYCNLNLPSPCSIFKNYNENTIQNAFTLFERNRLKNGLNSNTLSLDEYKKEIEKYISLDEEKQSILSRVSKRGILCDNNINFESGGSIGDFYENNWFMIGTQNKKFLMIYQYWISLLIKKLMLKYSDLDGQEVYREYTNLMLLILHFEGMYNAVDISTDINKLTESKVPLEIGKLIPGSLTELGEKYYKVDDESGNINYFFYHKHLILSEIPKMKYD